jgi:Class II flagellar assembly regulator
MIRIHGTSGIGGPAAPAKARRTASGTFSLETDTPARATTAPTGALNIGGIDTLLALQSVEEPGERRRKAVKRGRGALDALDALKLDLLAGTLDAAALVRLKTAAAGLAEPTGEAGLDTVLAEIALRVEVELAKIGMPQTGRQDSA